MNKELSLPKKSDAASVSLSDMLSWAGWVSGLIALVVLASWYWKTLPPGMSSLQISGWNDSAEFQIVGAYWGLEHSPGYPLYTILSNLWVRLVGLVAPQSEPAWRVSLFSLVTALATLMLFFATLIRLSVHPLLAAGALFLLGSSAMFWRHAIVAEVYGLNLLLIILAIWLALGWRQSIKERPYLIGLGLTFGAIAAHHRTGLLLAPIIGLWMIGVRPDGIMPWLRRIGWLAGSGAPMLLFYGYLPWAVINNERANMTRIYADASNAQMFWSMVLSREWWEVVQPPTSLSEAWQRLARIAGLQAVELRSTVLVFLGAAGLLAGGVAAIPLLGLAVLTALFGTSYAVYDIETMLIPLTTMLMLGVPLALQRLVESLRKRLPETQSGLAAGVVLVLASLLFLFSWQTGRAVASQVDQSNDTVGVDMVEMLRLLSEEGEPVSVIAYQHNPLAVVQYTRARYGLENLEPIYPNRLNELSREEARAELHRRWSDGGSIYYMNDIVNLGLVAEVTEGLQNGRYQSAPTYFPDLFLLLPGDRLPAVTRQPEQEVDASPVAGIELMGADQRWVHRRTGVYLEVALYWAAVDSIQGDYSISLQPEGPLAGAVEGASYPGFLLGSYPPNQMAPGERLRERYFLRLNSLPATFDGAQLSIVLQPSSPEATPSETITIPIEPLLAEP